MAEASGTNPRIARLTPLAELLAAIAREVQPVAPREVELRVALGSVLAADVTAPVRPGAPSAILDGWALAAEDTLGAGGYSPAPLPAIPHRVEVGQPMPPGADCVAPLDAVKVSGAQAEALATVNPGDGVLPAGGDCDGKTPLRRAGEVLRLIDCAVLGAAGVSYVSAIAPRILIVPLRDGDVIESVVRLVGADLVGHSLPQRADCGGTLAAALAKDDIDAIVAIGGTGEGLNDTSVRTLAERGRVVVHGLALSPGETAAFGFVGTKPVLLLPGRFDTALSAWLNVGRPMLDRLAARTGESEAGETLPLSRKVASTVGMAEVVPVRRAGGQAEPLGSKYLSLTALARSDGWILVPAESEGYSAGSPVRVRPWP